MKRLALSLTLLSLGILASAQSLPQYLQMRKQHGVNRASSVDDLGSVVGSKVLEVTGTVKGSFRVGSRTTILVDRSGGEQQPIDADAVPDWLVEGSSPARLLVRASRPDAGSALHVALIGAAHESDVRKYDVAPAAKKKAVATKTVKKSKASSRNGRSPLYGQITSRGSGLARTSRTWVLPASEVTPIYAAYIKRINPRLANSEALRMATAIVGFSLQARIDARLVIAMVMVESGFDPNAVSRTGAQGLGQLMPGTADWMGVRNAFDSVDNLYGMIKLIRTHLDQYKRQTGKDFESLVLTLAAYNAGEGAVRRAGGVPPYPETQRYVYKVLNTYYQLAGWK